MKNFYIDEIFNLCDNDIIEIRANEESFDCRYGVSSIPDEILDTPIESFTIKDHIMIFWLCVD